MQKAVLGLILSGAAACAPYSGFYKSGETVARLNADQTACEAAGARDVPPNTQIRRTPIEVIPARQVCTEGDGCRITPRRIEGGEVYSFDANADLRRRVVAQCMIDKGYQRVSVPQCSQQVAKVAAARAPTVLPPLSDGLCVARGTNRDLVFVTTVPAP